MKRTATLRFADWMAQGRLSPYTRALRTVGPLTLVEAVQPPGDMSDPPVADLLLTKIVTPGISAHVDLGAGRFSSRPQRGAFCLLPPHVASSVLVDDPHGIRVAALQVQPFAARMAELRSRDDPFDFGPLHANWFTSAELDSLFEFVWRSAETGDAASSLLTEGVTLAILASLSRLAGKAAGLARGGLAPWQLRRCDEYLRARLAEDVTLSELADLAGLSPFHFARQFKAATGLPPAAYQRRLRAEKAQELLLATDFSVTEIAFAVGYETPQAFARMFRAEVGATPSDWRRARRR